jgi:hypothetical protein
MPAWSTSPTVRYGLSVAGVDLPVAAWLAIIRASVMCVMSSLSTRRSELLVAPSSGCPSWATELSPSTMLRSGVLRCRRTVLSRRGDVRMPGRGTPEAAVVHGFPLRLLVFNLPDQAVLCFAEGAGQVPVISNRY